MKWPQIAAPLAFHGILFNTTSQKRDVCRFEDGVNNITKLSGGGIDFSDPAVAAALGSSDGSSAISSKSNHPVSGLPERVHDRHHRATGPGIRAQQSGTGGLTESSTECPTPPVLSCSSAADSTDSCCVVKPGGVLVHSQFWDTDEGLSDSWGIHGLYADLELPIKAY
jgi:hypothetical protein